jgi:hypothetical protein
MILQQELHGEDFQKRTEFCNFIQRQNGVYSHILFSDEATFRSDSIVNRHNMHYWSIDNPHWVRHVDYQVSMVYQRLGWNYRGACFGSSLF